MSHEPPDPFEESRKQLIEELQDDLAAKNGIIRCLREDGVSIEPREGKHSYAINNVRAIKAERHVELCRETLETLKKRIGAVNNGGLSYHQRLEEMIDIIDSALARAQ